MTTTATGASVVPMQRVGVVGLGAIGRQVCRALDDGIPGLRLAAGLARDSERASRFLATLRSSPPLLPL